MSSIDQRVVQMKFDNAQFERGIQTTLNSLMALNKGLKLEGASKGLSDVSAAARGFSLGNIASGVDQIASKFNAMSVIAVTALSKIVSKAMEVGSSIVKSLTIDPIKAGLDEYETNLNSIQTILSNTQWENAGLPQVNKALAELNLYSDKTIYNFSEMARNIGTFTAAGVKLDTSVKAIKGIANLAAISGSNSQQASTAMYQLSQALATGTVKLMDWNSVVNAGMGGKVFQDALKETARVHGVAVDDIIKKEGSFRDSLQKGWLTSEILTETLSKFTGDLTAQQLKAMGYNDQQIVGILKMGKTAQDAATKIKTFSQLLSTLQEAAGSGWAQTWQLIFGDFDEAKSMFTDVYNVLGGFITASANARNKVLGDWKALGGRTVLIQAISNAFNALIGVITPIKQAFREIFPATTGKQLYDLTVTIRDFTQGLKMGADTANNLKRTFAGVFAIFGIGYEILKQVVRTFFSLFDGAGKGAGSFLEITASIGDFLVRLHSAVKNGEDLTRFFDKVGSVLKVPIHLLGQFVSLLAKVVEGAANVDTSGVEKFAGRLEAFGRLGNIIANVWSRVLGALGAVAKFFAPVAQMMGQFFSDLGTEIQNSIGNIDYNSILDSINTGLLAGIALLLRKFLKGGVGVDLGGGFLSSIKDSFETLTGTLKAMQTQLKANALLKIAGAIAALTVSVVALSMIDSAKLTSALTAMAVMFTELLSSMAIFEKIGASKGFLKMPFVTTAMILLAVAIDLLSVAVAKLAGLDWEGLAKGLSGVIVLIAALAGAAKVISGSGKGMITAGAGFILLAGAIKLLVSSVTDLSGLNWEEMAKGLVGVAALLGSLALFTKFSAVGKGGIIQGAGIVLLAAGIKILASAMQDFAGLSWGDIAKGLAAMAVGLTLIGAALYLIPPTAVLSAAGVLVVAASLGMISDAIGKMGKISWGDIGRGLTVLAVSLTAIALAIGLLPPTSLLSAAAIFVTAASLGMLAKALGTMGGMSWGEIAKGLVTLAGSLGIIAIAMAGMTAALPGAAALLVVSAALQVLTPVLVTMGNMSWGEIGKGLLMLAGAFTVLGVAGLLLTPLVPTLIGLGAAIALIGVGVLAAGVGILALSAALTALAAAGAVGTAAIVGMVSAILGLIPVAMQQLGLGIIAFAKVISTGGPAITAALVTVLLSLLNAINKTAPQIISTLGNLMLRMLNAMIYYVPRMTDAGLKILIGFLQGVANNIGRVVTVAVSIITNFLNAIGANIPRIIQSGVNLILNFINGLSAAIDRNSSQLGAAGARLGMSIIRGMVNGIAGGIGEVTSAARRVASSALDAAKNFLGIGSPSKRFYEIGMWANEGMANGLDHYSKLVTASSAGVGRDAILAMQKSISGMSDLVSGNIDLNPTITPVLDLSKVQKDSVQIGSLLALKPLAVSASVGQARNASLGYQANQVASMIPQAGMIDNRKTVNYSQTINSPKPVSSAEVYRQTKNQLSVVKKELK